MKTPFDYFDKIYCICGNHEVARWENCKVQFEKLGIMNRVERFSDFGSHEELKKCKMDPCKHSHYSIMKLANKAALKRIFIFESDFQFINYDLELIDKSFKSLEKLDWKMFFMGGVVHNVYEVINKNLVKASVSQAHAYAINGCYLGEIIKKYETSTRTSDQINRRVKNYQIGNYCYYSYPMFVVQSETQKERKRTILASKTYQNKVEPKMREFLKQYNELH